MEPTSLTSIPSSAAGRPAPKLEDEPPVARDRQLGWALVGLGKLTLGELLPAFAETRFCKLTALVSGNPGKARQVATQQGLELDAIYDYSGFDRIALDQRSPSSTSSCRTRCTPPTRFALCAPASTSCAKSRWRPR